MTDKEKIKVLNELINRFADSKTPHENDYLYNVLKSIRADYQKSGSKTKTVDGIVFAQLEEGEIMVRSHYFKSESLKYLDEVKMIIVKED